VQPDRAAVIIVGDAAEVEPQIKEYADAIEVYDIDGNRKE
jgi:predicted Zn-dependent peptidase